MMDTSTTRQRNRRQYDADAFTTAPSQNDSKKPASSPAHSQLKQHDSTSYEEKKSEDDAFDIMLKQQQHNAQNIANAPSYIPSTPPSTTPRQELQQTQPQGSLPFLIFCATGICTCYLTYGILQERLFTPDSFLKDLDGPITTFLLVVGMLTNVLVAQSWIFMERYVLGVKVERDGGNNSVLNHGLLLLTSFCYVAAMTASNESLNYVSYPTVVLAKSSKLIPTMVMGFFIEHKSYSVGEWLGASLITAGITIFNFSRMSSSSAGSDDDDSQHNSTYGLALLVFSLSMDGLLSSCQGILKTQNSISSNKQQRCYRCPTAMETMLFINLYATFFLCPLCIYTGQFNNGMKLLLSTKTASTGGGGGGNDDVSAAHVIALLNICAAAGQVFIFFTIHYFSPLMCTTITTTRKFFTILLSVRNFGHVFNAVQWSSIFMVFGGLYFEIVSKKNLSGKKNKKMKQT